MHYTPAEHRRLAIAGRLRAEAIGWGFILPFLIFFMVFMVIPVVLAFWWSFQRGGLTNGSFFVGLDNYLTLTGQPAAPTALGNTFAFALMSIPVTLVLAFFIASLLSRVNHGGAVYRFLIYFPALVPGTIAALIWVYLTNVDFGLFNNILGLFGIDPVTWLGANTALPVLAGTDVWINTGFWAIFFVSAIIGLPPELDEAAEVDGANARQRLFRVRLPQLRRMILYAVVVATIWGMQCFDTAFVLTSGGPGTSTTTAVFLVYNYVFRASDKAGYGAAISVVLLLVIFALTAIQFRALRGRRGED